MIVQEVILAKDARLHCGIALFAGRVGVLYSLYFRIIFYHLTHDRNTTSSHSLLPNPSKSGSKISNQVRDHVSTEGCSIPTYQTSLSSAFSERWGLASFGRMVETTDQGYVGVALELCKRGDLMC